MNGGDDKIKQYPNCGEGIYLVDTECVKLCPKCGDVVFQYAKRN